MVWPRTRRLTCPGQLGCVFIITFYFSLLNIIFKYYMIMTTKIDDVGGCGQRATSGTAQDTSNDVSWAIGVFFLLLLSIFHY